MGAGRRPGKPDTRGAILDVAREHFVEFGFAKTSLRGIARDAGVDPALVHHYFADKHALFLAALSISFDPVELVRRVASEGPDNVGHRIITTAHTLWESPMGVTMHGAMRSDSALFGVFGPYMVEQIVKAAMAALQITRDEAQERASLMQAVMTGLVFSRYIMCVDPLASLPRELLIRDLAPILQHIITGDLDPRRARR